MIQTAERQISIGKKEGKSHWIETAHQTYVSTHLYSDLIRIGIAKVSKVI